MPLIMTVPNYTIQDLQLSSVRQRNKSKELLKSVPDERKTDENFHDMLHPDRAADRRETKKGTGKRRKYSFSFTKSKYIPDSIKGSCGKWTGEQFETADSIIFIGAAGIAVRSIAPFIQNKKKDPAVLVVDELGKFVISLLSGHLGGANELACLAADILQAIPVVTTATDLEGKFAVDVFAKKNNCHIFRMKEAKEVSAALLAGEKVGFFSEFPCEGELPKGLIWCRRTGIPLSEALYETVDGTPLPEMGIAVTVHKSCQPFASTTHVVPPAVVLGMGCRKNKESEAVENVAFSCTERK
ncbi:MAG: cobalt-precorrin 5A hydrolase [Ruminococcus sp.]